MNTQSTSNPISIYRVTVQSLTIALWAGSAMGVLAVGFLAGCGQDDGESPGPRIEWDECSEAEFQGSQCGTIPVPIDWSEPGGSTIELALVRRPADDSGARIGTLFLNNGGGASSIEQLRLALSLGVDLGDLATRFDLVAVDLRGIGQSASVQCGRSQRSMGITYFPADQTAFDDMVRDNQALYAACREKTGPLLDHLDLESMSRDLDAVRAALGEEQVSFYGIHLSTLLGRTYAGLFPGRLRLLALDTALDDSASPRERVLRETRALEDSFGRFVSWCESTPPVPDTPDQPGGGCALHGEAVAALFDETVLRAEKTPLPVSGGDPLTAEDVRHAPQVQLVQTLAWPLFGSALLQAAAGNATLLTVNPDDTFDALQDHAINCAITPPAASNFAELSELRDQMHELAPHTGGATVAFRTAAGCIGWSNRPDPDALSPVADPPPTLIVQSLHQSLSHYDNAAGLSRQLPGSVVLSRDGDDYSMFLFSPCVAADMSRFFTDLRLPKPSKICTD
ncbi:MAG: alpha/beta hydrolase [Proteobacteria bacterium]|nr:alpha/beta hydrolase [Pseudomonadota bacterium]